MNVKPGDLAVIVHALCEENIGVIVRVARAGQNHRALGPTWWIESDRPRPHRFFGTNRFDGTWSGGLHPDAWLRPIRSDGITKEEVRELYEPQKQGKQVHLAAPNGPQGPVQAPQETA